MLQSKTLEYEENALPKAMGQRLNAKNKTLFVTKKGEFLSLATEAQAKKTVASFMKRFNPEEWWAQKVSRSRLGDSDYFTAFISRDFSAKHDKSDIAETGDHQMWLGRHPIGIPAMTTDRDEHSETHNKRIPATMDVQLADGTIGAVPILEKQGYYSYHKANPENVKLYKKMCGLTSDDIDTEYVFVLAKGGRVVGADDPDDIWEMSCADMRLEDRNLKKLRRKKQLATVVVDTANEKLV